jgi:hypothetical protein
MPWVAGRPFFIVICFASLISREALHFTQYPVATGHLHARISTRRLRGTHPSQGGGYRTPHPIRRPKATKPRHRGGASW